MSGRVVSKALCAWCGEQPVKLTRHTCCSLSCAAQKRWQEMSQDGRLQRVIGGQEAAHKNGRVTRLLREIEQETAQLGIQVESWPQFGLLRRLYVRAHNHGYHAGYEAACRRARKGAV